MSSFTFHLQNFRALERLRWSPDGVCLLAGPNGSGKTTVLDALTFLKALFLRGHGAAFRWVGGEHLRSLTAPKAEPVCFEVVVDGLCWRTSFPVSSGGLAGYFGEELSRDGEAVLRAGVFEQHWTLGTDQLQRDPERCCAKVLWDRGTAPWMEPLVDVLSNIHVHHTYNLDALKGSKPATGMDTELRSGGKNLWSVLSNWNQAPIRQNGKFRWVVEHAQHAFPDIFSALEFDRGIPIFYGPRSRDPDDGLPMDRAAEGLLTGLLHLTAVAGAADGAVIALDEMENQLHPHAIRAILKAMREEAEARDLTIILTTHSPVVMNAFKGREDQFFVLQQSHQGDSPCPLDELYDEDWLEYFVLGDLYERNKIAAPAPTKPSHATATS